MATKLGVYNSALTHLEERALSALTDSVESRRAIDAVYTETVNLCLEAAQWKFAKRVVEIEASDSISPTFGFTYAFAKPTDLVRLTALSSSDRLQPPLLDYSEEGDYWYADVDPLYVAYVSNDTEWGFDLGKWPPSFAEYVAVRLAAKSAGRLMKGDKLRDTLKKEERTAMGVARANDAMGGPPAFLPSSNWSQARHGSTSVFAGRRYLRG